MNEISTRAFGAPPAALKEYTKGQLAPEAGAGISGGFAVVSLRGKVWRVKHRGVEAVVPSDDGDGPRASIEVVMVRTALPISKIYYEKGYEQGSTAKPDCWSVNGLNPDPAAPKKQSATCAGCKHDAFGTGVNGKGKRCQDSKRVAVVPLNDLDNDLYGGPMLLRIPPATLQELKAFEGRMLAAGYPLYAFGTRLGFDVDNEFPKITFREIRTLTDAEFAKVTALRTDVRTKRILDEAVEHVTAEEEPVTPQVNFEQPPAPKATAPKVVAPPKEVAPAPAAAQPAPKAQAKPPAEEVGPAPEAFESLLDGLLETAK